MSEKRSPPSAFRIEQAMAAADAVRHAILADDPDFASDETALRDLLDGETDAYDMLRRMVRFALDSDAQADAADARAKAISARKARFERRAQSARGAILAMMDALGEVKFSDPEFTVTMRAPVAGVMIIDETALPAQFVKTTAMPMKKDIAAALKSGLEVPGAVLANGMPSIIIKGT